MSRDKLRFGTADGIAVSLVSKEERMLKLQGIVVFFALPCLFAQQPTRNEGNSHKVICSPVSAGKIVKFVKPVFPPEATMKALSGAVLVEGMIDNQGVPKNLRVTKGYPILAKAVVKALQQWRWKPYKLNGEAVEVESSVYVRFEPASN
jgi:TonB family protein